MRDGFQMGKAAISQAGKREKEGESWGEEGREGRWGGREEVTSPRGGRMLGGGALFQSWVAWCGLLLCPTSVYSHCSLTPQGHPKRGPWVRGAWPQLVPGCGQSKADDVSCKPVTQGMGQRTHRASVGTGDRQLHQASGHLGCAVSGQAVQSSRRHPGHRPRSMGLQHEDGRSNYGLG